MTVIWVVFGMLIETVHLWKRIKWKHLWKGTIFLSEREKSHNWTRLAAENWLCDFYFYYDSIFLQGEIPLFCYYE